MREEFQAEFIEFLRTNGFDKGYALLFDAETGGAFEFFSMTAIDGYAVMKRLSEHFLSLSADAADLRERCKDLRLCKDCREQIAKVMHPGEPH